MPNPRRKRRPCPRGLYDGCPIPRELCQEDHDRAGRWRCLDLLAEFERFVFPDDADREAPEDTAAGPEEIQTLDDLMAALRRMDRAGMN